MHCATSGKYVFACGTDKKYFEIFFDGCTFFYNRGSWLDSITTHYKKIFSEGICMIYASISVKLLELFSISILSSTCVLFCTFDESLFIIGTTVLGMSW